MRDSLRAEFTSRLDRARWLSLAAAAAGGLLSLLGLVFAPRAFFAGWLIAFLFWLGISLGAWLVLMVHHLTDGGWGRPVRRILEAAAALVPVMGLLFLPLVLVAFLPVWAEGSSVARWLGESAYPWARPDAASHLPADKLAYLSPLPYLLRSAVYFLVWSAAVVALIYGDTRSDPAQQRSWRRPLRLISGPGILLLGLGVTFASVDWGMSLEPHWFSSIYGVLYLAGQIVSGLAFSIVLTILLARYRPWREQSTADRRQDLGSLLLASVMFWTYISTMQFVIIWSANLAEEAPWYLHRSAGGWQFVAFILFLGHFLAPFFVLLSRSAKRSEGVLLAVAGLLLAMQWTNWWWLIEPSLSPGRLSLHWMHLAAFLAVGGVWLAVFCGRLAAFAAIPVFETIHPQIDEEAGHAHPGRNPSSA